MASTHWNRVWSFAFPNKSEGQYRENIHDLLCAADDEEEEVETLRQFLLDAPRMHVSVDHQKWKKSPSKLFSEVFCRHMTRSQAIHAASFCTQTALAPYFCLVQEQLGVHGFHFVDGGRQFLSFDTKSNSFEILKPFKVVDFDSECNDCVLFFVDLKLNVDAQANSCVHSFHRGEGEWIMLEDDELVDQFTFKTPSFENVELSPAEIVRRAIEMRDGST